MQIRAKEQKKQPSAIGRMASHAMLTDEQEVLINQHIRLKVYSITCAEAVPEEHARFLFLPFGEERYSVQLLYLKNGNNGDEASIYSVEFYPDFFVQWPEDLLLQQKAFRSDRMAEQQFTICKQSDDLLDILLRESVSNKFSHSLQLTETALHLFRRAIDQLTASFTVCPVPACRFLAYESEREKIAKAKAIIEERFDESITIKELSRKVAMNECYLKKGFKALTGKTIHEYQQAQRIGRARIMLQAEGRSVTEVAALLGYSSISHFSTAFKRATGTKPCELLQ
jgi:AraC-like DNA-binding protein